LAIKRSCNKIAYISERGLYKAEPERIVVDCHGTTPFNNLRSSNNILSFRNKYCNEN